MKKADSIYNPQKYPMLFPAVAFIFGIIIQNYAPLKLPVLLFVIVLTIIWNFFMDSFTPRLFNKLFWQNCLLILAFICLGALRIGIDDPDYNPSHMSHFLDDSGKQMNLKGIVKEIEGGEKTTKVDFEINAIEIDGQWIGKNGKTILYLDSMPENLRLFDEIVCKTSKLPTYKPNPFTFDYGQFLARKNIYFTGYVKAAEDISILRSNRISIWDWPLVSRNYLNERLSQWIKDPQAYALITAMLLGERNRLDKNTIAIFSNTGAIHVLAVSGLHVGILIHLLYLIMGLFKANNKIKMLVAIGVGMCYALLVGAAPSIIRASFLISLILLGNYFKAYVNIYNLLSLVALTMLIFNPNDFFTISFQFSFVAILSLALFTKPIYEMIEFKGRFPQMLWKLLSATLAAQVLMTPMVVFYFHQFPLYFFLSCFVAIPLAYIGIVGGGYILITSFLLPAGLTYFLANIISKCVNLGYILLEEIGKLPYALWNKLFLSLPGLLLIAAIIISLYAYFISRRKTYLFVCNALLVLLVFDELMAIAQDHKTSSMTIYDMREGTLIDFFDGNTCLTFKTENVSMESEKFAAENNRLSSHIKQMIYIENRQEISTSNFVAKDNNITFRDLKIKIVNSELDTSQIDEYNLLIVSSNLPELPIIQNKLVVINNKINYKTLNLVKQNCLNCRIWSIKDRGYYFQKLD